MSNRPPVLVLGNDFSLAAAKTSRHLGRALEKLGCAAVVRDTRLNRWGARLVEAESVERRAAFETAVVAKWARFVDDYGIQRIVSLDLHWLLSSQLFVDHDQIQHIDSFWFDDLRSHFLVAPMFDLVTKTPLELISHPKVRHHCYGRGQAEELRQLGVTRIENSFLAAPAQMLQAGDPCPVQDRLGFVGNPGLESPPSPAALAAMERGDDLAPLRELARDEILADLPCTEPTSCWITDQPKVADLLAEATAAKLQEPDEAAIILLQRAGRAYPEAYNFLNRAGVILDAALLVKLVRRYDRPALVRRLWRRGWLEVHGSPAAWEAYGVRAQATVSFPRLASVYRRYPAQLNAANCARDATANEKLFEIAACARASLNLPSPDVLACFSCDEIFIGDSIAAIEHQAHEILRDLADAFARGERARRRVAREHTWEHRLAKAFP